jgi:hypothetical protein
LYSAFKSCMLSRSRRQKLSQNIKN